MLTSDNHLDIHYEIKFTGSWETIPGSNIRSIGWSDWVTTTKEICYFSLCYNEGTS